MSRLLQLANRIRAFFRSRSIDRDLDAELEAHLALAIDDYVARGYSRQDARRAALIHLGGIQQAREKHRTTRGLMTLDIFFQDAKYTFRTLFRDPGFTFIAVLILALGIGANVAVFSVVNTILLRPLPFADSGRLVWIAPPPSKCGMSCATYSTDAYDEFREHTRSFTDVTGYFAFSGPGNLSLSFGGAPIPATGIDVIHNFFQLLGVNAAMGRTFNAADAENGAAPVILLSNAWWHTQFNADPNIVGKSFDINGRQTTVIGVLPTTFDFGSVFAPGTKVDALTPLNLYGPPRNWGNIITMIGRLKPGVTLAQARGDAAQAVKFMCWNNRRPESCGTAYRDGVVPVSLKSYVMGRLRRSLIVLWCAVAAILLIACVNLSNLLLSRAAARSKEFAMRSALGASRTRIVTQLLTESMILSAGGAIFGLLLAAILVSWLAHQGSIALPMLSLLHLDGAAIGWTVMIAVVAALIFGLAPGLRLATGNLQEALKDSGPGTGTGRKHERIRSILVVSEVALACMLLVGAGLLLRSFLKVLDVDLGFQPARAAAISVDYDDSVPNDKDGSLSALKRSAIFQEVIARVSALPGVEAAGIVDYLPLGQNRAWGTPLPEGIKPPNKIPAGPLVYVATPGYLRAMGTPLRGRDFAWSDGPKSEQVVIIDAAFAKYLAGIANWTDGDALGKTLVNGKSKMRIVGIADDVHEQSTEENTGWQIYYPATQQGPSGAELVIRTRLQPSALATPVLQTLREMNPKQTAADFKPIQMLVDHANSPRRFFMLLVASFATLGLLLAALGIYGVIGYSVTRKTQEIGIRMALGASAQRVERDVLAGTLRLALTGVALGTIASLAVARLIATLLYGTSPFDVITYLAITVGLLLVALASGYIPARRAARVDPMAALRSN
ncbi:MAG: ABC transporter permease [Acidobacteriota bacterium]|nr:ABC transporter permease [Acidobacteriota bacterium]